MPYSLVVTSHFDAAHYLRDYEGPCQQIHGHRWTVEIELEGETLNELGILVDFKDIKKALNRETTDYFDHFLMNELKPFDEINPTAENLARHIYQSILPDMRNMGILGVVELNRVTVWESPESAATYYEKAL